MAPLVRAMVFGIGTLASWSVPAQAPPAAADVVPGIWQQHKQTISYFGITAAYACDALEDQVKRILVHLGARPDAKVSANGCARGPDAPTRNAWIEADFYTLAPAADPSSTGAVKAHWVKREVKPNRPTFMGDGDCELIEQMKDLITKNFATRDWQYRTDCVPHQVTINGFSIEGQTLVAVGANPGTKGS